MSVGLNIAMTAAESALRASQQQISIISNNISQANNSAYRAQSTVLTSGPMIAGDAGYYGTGAYISEVVRAYDSALEDSLRGAISDSSYSQTYCTQLGQIEDIVGPGGESALNDAMLEFADNMQAVASNPEEITSRTALVGSAESLESMFNLQYENLSSYMDYIAGNDVGGDGALNDSCTELQGKLEQVAELNEEIARLEGNLFIDQSANSLRDERDQLCREISEYVDINITEESDGKYTIDLKLDGGATATLVDGTTSPQADPDYLNMTMVENPAGCFTPQIELNSAPGVAVGLNPESGSIQGLMDSREYICNEMTELYDYAAAFAADVNALQNQANAYDLDGNNNAGDFFTVPATQPASGSIITTAISDPIKIAASSSATQKGNGSNAQDIWEKINEDNTIDGDSYLDHSNRMLTDISLDVSQAASKASSLESVKEVYQNAILQKCGVDTDSEMAKMIEVQRTYQAAAKVISVVDEMLQTVLAMI